MVWSAGATLTAAQLNTYLPQAWSGWTPALTGTTNPAIGNGVASGRYVAFGKTVHFSARIIFGSTSTFGSGAWSLSLPLPRVSGTVIRASCLYFDTSTGGSYLGQSYGNSATGTIALGLDTSAANGVLQGVTPTAPFTWASGDEIEVSGTYEAA